MTKERILIKIIIAFFSCLIFTSAHAARPKFSIVPVTAGGNQVEAVQGSIFDISYTVTNNLKDTKTLSTRLVAHVTQRTNGTGYCARTFTLQPGQSCTLRLRINTTGISLGSVIQGGPEVCIGLTNLSCAQPSFANRLMITVTSTPDALLSISPSEMVTATSTIAGSDGVRTLTISNAGPASATDLNYTYSPALPTGTTATGCGATITAGSSCTLTITPGSTPSTSAATVPTPSTLVITGSNVNTLTTDITVLTYGNIYQGGYVYKIDATTSSNTNVSGSVAELTDFDSAQDIPWSPEGLTNTVVGATSLIDGLTNTQAILFTYGLQHGPVYAAFMCERFSVADNGGSCVPGHPCFTGWYLPAPCEINSANTAGANCSAYPDSMMSNLYDNGIGNFPLTSNYWSSATLDEGASALVWGMAVQATVSIGVANNGLNLRCTRLMT